MSVSIKLENEQCSHEVALRFLLKIRRYPQGDDEDDEAYAARLDGLPDPDVKVYRGIKAANEASAGTPRVR